MHGTYAITWCSQLQKLKKAVCKIIFEAIDTKKKYLLDDFKLEFWRNAFKRIPSYKLHIYSSLCSENVNIVQSVR